MRTWLPILAHHGFVLYRGKLSTRLHHEVTSLLCTGWDILELTLTNLVGYSRYHRVQQQPYPYGHSRDIQGKDYKIISLICATDKLLSIILTKIPPKPAATTFAMLAAFVRWLQILPFYDCPPLTIWFSVRWYPVLSALLPQFAVQGKSEQMMEYIKKL